VDLIGDAVAATRAGEPRSARARLVAPWGLRLPATGGIGFHIVVRGGAWLLPPDGSAAIRLSAGDVVLVSRSRTYGLADHPHTPLADVGPGPHAYWTPDSDLPGGVTPTVLLGGSYYLHDVRPHPLIAALPAVIHFSARDGDLHSVRSVVDLLAAEMDSDHVGGNAAVPALLDLLLIYGIRAWYERADVSVGWAEALRDPGLSRALSAVQRHPAHHWTVEHLAREADMSRAVFARRFRELIGQPPVAYLTWWRMTVASAQLRETTSSVAAVAGRVGYDSEFAFSRAFRREFGLAPGLYRRHHRSSGVGD
jgi:AraC-like DNA-binding protein